MSGVKGRSGRRPRSVEEKRYATIDKAWQVLDEFLGDKSIPVGQKVDVAVKVAVKDMPADAIIDQSKHIQYIVKWKENNEKMSVLPKSFSTENLAR